MKSVLKKAVLAGAIALGAASAVDATPFVDFEIVGSTTYSSAGQGYSATVNAAPGQTIYHDVLGIMNQNAVANSTKPYTLTAGQVSGTDGINSAQFNLADPAGQLKTPANVDLNGALGTSGGTATGAAITGIDVAGAAGTFAGGTTPVLLVDGSFAAGTYSSDIVSGTGNYGGANVGGIKADTTVGQKTIQLNNASEGSPGAPGGRPVHQLLGNDCIREPDFPGPRAGIRCFVRCRRLGANHASSPGGVLKRFHSGIIPFPRFPEE